jgi:Zn ribbon nucleic-acid-binding protein
MRECGSVWLLTSLLVAGIIILSGSGSTPVRAAERPLMPVDLRPGQLDAYKSEVEPVLAMSEEEMLSLVPGQSGLYFVGCPNCTAGHQEGQLRIWKIEQPNKVSCNYCGHVYPSEKYPETGAVEVQGPDGTSHRYPYWENAEGYRYYFEARIDYHKIRYWEKITQSLARLYRLTGDEIYGRRAALLLQKFAQVFPGYCFHYDYPFRQKMIFDGTTIPDQYKRMDYRVSRWTWWAYLDISRALIEAYDLLADSPVMQQVSRENGIDGEEAVEAMLVSMTEQVLENREDLSNMSPGMWADFIAVGRVLVKPEYVHLALDRLHQLIQSKFFADGSWVEGAPSYHTQVVGALRFVFSVAKGYSDPPGYTHPETGTRLDDLNLETDIPEVANVINALMSMRMPDGRLVPVHDTWWTQKQAAPEVSQPYLLGGMGHGILGRGQGPTQQQVHLTWSPGLGHTHYDGLSLLLFSHGGELLSDLGYTHSRAREWTLASAAHNLVVVDQINQRADRTTHGKVRYMATPPQGPQILSVDNPEVYPGLTDTYRRTVALVPVSDDNAYLLDVFTVTGGQTHDYFLHGNADANQTLTISPAAGLAPGKPLATLVPEGVDFTPATNEQETPALRENGAIYGYLTDLQERQVEQHLVGTATFKANDGGPVLQAHLLLQPGDQWVTGENMSIRRAQEDDAKLPDFQRQFMMLRRGGGDSQFVSVIQVADGEAPIKAVRAVTVAGARQAIEVELASGERDLILVEARQASGEWLGQRIEATGDLALLRGREGQTREATVVGGAVSCGRLSLDAGPEREAALLAVTRPGGAPTLVVAGELLPPPDTFITVDHGGQYTSAFRVKEATRDGDNSIITLAEEPGFKWDPVTETSQFTYQPLSAFTGPHNVKVVPTSYLHQAR